LTENVTTFATLIADGALQIGDGYRAKNSELNGNGLPFMRSALVQDSGINLAEAERFPEEQTQMLQPKCTRPDDVVITTKGNSTGRTAVIRSDHPIAVYSPHLSFWRVLNRTVVDPGFLRQWSRSNRCQDQIRAMMSSTDMAPYLSLGDQSRLQIVLPPLPRQLAIAGILGVLDDKIELNRKMSAALETIARALFKSWFVDFDPVRAKAEGRDPGLPAEIAALFPDSFEDTAHGQIPSTWTLELIGEIADIVGGSTPSTSVPSYWGGPFGWVTPKDLAELANPVLLATNRTISEEGLSKISSGLLPVGTVLLSSRAPIGYLAVTLIPVAINQGFIALKARQGISNLFLFRWVEASLEEILARANGSTFLEISKTNFRPIPVVVPAARVMQTFDAIVRPLHERLVLCERQARMLAALRDALLPKLISGELRVGEAERVLAASA
jgi:type I restriction enzyme, S subunit